eukprot:jgi/Undpi1/13581/HiC_scaffold_8.g03239.m1
MCSSPCKKFGGDVLELIELCWPQSALNPTYGNQMFWLASNDTGGEDNFKSRVSVFLGGVESQELTWVPYNRIVLSDEEKASKIRIGLTDMGPESLAAVASDQTCGVDDQLGSSQATDTSNAGHQVSAATPVDTWPSTGKKYVGRESGVGNQLSISQATDNTCSGDLGVVDNRLDISQPSHTSYNDDEVSVDESYV